MPDDTLTLHILSQVIGEKMKDVSKAAQQYVWESHLHDFCVDCGTIFHVSQCDTPCPGCESLNYRGA